MESDLLEPYEKLITISVLGKTLEVPEKNKLLRCFQFLSLQTISYGDFCWNGECTNCQVWYHTGSESASSDRPALSCKLEVTEGMVVTSMSPFIKIGGVTK
jgi:NADH dehydrogenase/NADH:ubiquinone oxidoreductase subunit G